MPSARAWSSVYLGWAFGVGLASATAASCTEADPDHCRHQGGDVSCRGSTPYCDQCLSSDDNGGCVAEPPSDRCAFPGDEPYVETTGATTGGESTGSDAVEPTTGTTTGPAPDCTAEGGRDDGCPDNAPFCVDGSCTPCSEGGGDALCAAIDAATPVCANVDCVACSTDDTSACDASTPFCNAGVCSGCFEHPQCGVAGCDLVAGECLPERLVVWAEGPECNPADGFGTEDEPYCNLSLVQQFIDGLPSPEDTKVTLRIKSGTFDQPILLSGEGAVLVIIGDDGAARIDTSQAINTFAGARVYVDNVVLSGNGDSTVRCNTGGVFWARDTDIADNPSDLGLEIQADCRVTIERGIVTGNGGGGMIATDADVTLESTGIVANGGQAADTHAVEVDGGSLTARHVTLVENFGTGQGVNLSCTGDPTVSVRNSIVMREDGASFSGCTFAELRNTLVDDAALVSEDEGIGMVAYLASYFADAASGNPRLQADTPFEDVAVWAEGDPRRDLDGAELQTVVGATNDAGCDQR